MKPNYGAFESCPTRYTDTEAWVLWHGAKVWTKMNSGEVLHHAAVLSEAEYHKNFPNLPPLPPEAFSTDPWTGKLKDASPTGVGKKKITPDNQQAERTATNSSDQGAADQKVLADLNPRQRRMVQEVMDNNPGISAERALAELKAFGM